MPSPIGHALGGVLCALALGGRRPELGRAGPLRRLVADPLVRVAAVAAMLPDVDFLWGRHGMETHSLGAAVAAGVAAALVLGGGHRRLALVVAAAWASHVLFDWLGSDDTPPLGVMALWPWTTGFYFADAYVFDAISRRYWLPGFWRHNLGAVASELVMLVPLAGALALWRGRPQPPPSD
ncbi:MAG: metal-dependent hydrolase [Vicinamibacterales bacterium]